VAIEILTSLLVIITGFYAWVTFRIMKANERTVAAMHSQIESATRPYIAVGLVTIPNSNMFYLRVAV
jgi:hypothetical protein